MSSRHLPRRASTRCSAGSALLLTRWLLCCLLSDITGDYWVSNGGLFAERVFQARQQKEEGLAFMDWSFLSGPLGMNLTGFGDPLGFVLYTCRKWIKCGAYSPLQDDFNKCNTLNFPLMQSGQNLHCSNTQRPNTYKSNDMTIRSGYKQRWKNYSDLLVRFNKSQCCKHVQKSHTWIKVQISC